MQTVRIRRRNATIVLVAGIVMLAMEAGFIAGNFCQRFIGSYYEQHTNV